jgi:hypothetical protein
MTRKGELWRGEVGQHIEDYLAGGFALGVLIDWALDHPFFEDRADLTGDEQTAIAQGLGTILQSDPNEPFPTRVSHEQLREAVDVLWGRRKPRS